MLEYKVHGTHTVILSRQLVSQLDFVPVGRITVANAILNQHGMNQTGILFIRINTKYNAYLNHVEWFCVKSETID